MHERLEQLLQLHNMCSQELHQLQTNVENYLQSSAKMVNMVQNSWREIERGNGLTLMIYDNFLTSITNVMNYSRKLNMQLLLNYPNNDNEGDNMFDSNGRHPKDKAEDENRHGNESNRQICNKTLDSSTNHSASIDLEKQAQGFFPAEEIYMTKETREDFVYPKLKLTESYAIGSILSVHVTYIKSLDELKFYVLDPSSENVLNVAEVSQCLDLHQYHTLPPAHEVFGLVLDKRILRAVRSTKVLYDQEQDEEIWPCYLLDFGEIVNLKLNDIKYKLTEMQMVTPACALLCQLKVVEPHKVLRDKLRQMEYRECNLKIVDIKDDMFVVELAQVVTNGSSQLVSPCHEKQPTADTINRSKKELTKMISNSTSRPPASVSNNIKSTSGKSTKSYLKNNANSFTQPLTESLPSSCLKTNKNPFTQPLKTKKNNLPHPSAESMSNKLTPEELEMLYDEPLNTSNVMTAVLGYDPQDEKRICRFYDPATGGCFKGVNCKQEHVPLHPEGWTKDVLPAVSIIDNRSPQIVYPKGTILNITPTYIGQLGTFYAQINDAHHNNIPLLWNDDDIPPWKRLQRPPHVFELVLSRYEDGLWYRAKILNHDDNYRMFKVFYVDYGNYQIVDLRNLAKCDYGNAQAPFQAILCRLAYLQEIEVTAEMRKAGIKMLCDMLLNIPVDVKVVSHHEDLIVSIVGDLNLTIKSKLVHGGYMKPL